MERFGFLQKRRIFKVISGCLHENRVILLTMFLYLIKRSFDYRPKNAVKYFISSFTASSKSILKKNTLPSENQLLGSVPISSY